MQALVKFHKNIFTFFSSFSHSTVNGSAAHTCNTLPKMKQINIVGCFIFCLSCRTSGDIIYINWSDLWSGSDHHHAVADLVRCVCVVFDCI